MHQQRWRVFWIRNEYTLDYQITQDFASTFSQFKQTLKLALIQKAYNHLEHANIFMHNALGIRYVFMFLCLYSLPSQTMMRIKVSTYICNMTTRSKIDGISFDDSLYILIICYKKPRGLNENSYHSGLYLR